MNWIVTKLIEAISNRVQNKTNTISDSYGLQFPKSLSEKNQEKISFHQLYYYKRFISNRSTIQVWKDCDFLFPTNFLSYQASKELDQMNLTEFNRETNSEILHLGCQIMGYNCKGTFLCIIIIIYE